MNYKIIESTRKRKVKSASSKKKRASKRDICRKWGLPDTYQTANLRYQNPIEKGIYWYFFSLFIRKRDIERWGACISCGRAITVETCDAGHFCPAGSSGYNLLFNEKNVNAECSHCNAWDDMHLIGYQKGLDKRYGDGTAHALIKQRKAYKNGAPVKDFTKAQYEQKLTNLIEELKG